MHNEKEKTVRAPYNFVPFSPKKPLQRYGAIEELPRQDCIDPALHTGEIHVTLTAKTPIYVSDGNGRFFRDGNGTYAIPGSTIRGMTRQNAQILGFGLMCPGRDFENRRLFYRMVASGKDTTSGELFSYYKSALNIKIGQGEKFAKPQNIKPGYLTKDESGYHIIPTKENCFIRVSKKLPDVQTLNGCDEEVIPVVYRLEGERVKSIRRSQNPEPGMQKGMLLFTGRPVGNKPNPAYLFPQADYQAQQIDISKEDSLAYELDWEDRKNTLKRKEFRKLPEYGEEKPVFYVRAQGHTYFGMSLFPRIGYPNDLQNGLPKSHKDALQEECFLDYPRSMFGFIGKTQSYRSRVSFGDFSVVGNAQELKPFTAISGNPKPSYYPGYVENGEHYGKDNFLLRGYKQYWLKEFAEPAKSDKEKVVSTLHPLKEGAKFQGIIRFRNLHEDELGLLLWALRLDKGCYQSVGMGKAYGLGRMELKIDCLKEFSGEHLYADLCAGADVQSTETADRYIQAYDDYASAKLYLKKSGKKKPSLRNLDLIQDFMYIHSRIMSQMDASYMELSEYKNMKQPLPTIRDIRSKEFSQKSMQELAKKALSVDDLRAMMAAKFNSEK